VSLNAANGYSDRRRAGPRPDHQQAAQKVAQRLPHQDEMPSGRSANTSPRMHTGSYLEPTSRRSAIHSRWLAAIKPTDPPHTHHSYSRNLHSHVLPPARVGAATPHRRGHAQHACMRPLLAMGARTTPEAGCPSQRAIRPRDHPQGARDAGEVGEASPESLRTQPTHQSDRAAPESITWTQTSYAPSSRNPRQSLLAAYHLLATTGLRRGEALGCVVVISTWTPAGIDPANRHRHQAHGDDRVRRRQGCGVPSPSTVALSPRFVSTVGGRLLSGC
jgi:hypothetical protein